MQMSELQQRPCELRGSCMETEQLMLEVQPEIAGNLIVS
jgi:hypothetical protein